MYGLANGLPMLHLLSDKYDIILLQELWLCSFDFHKLSDVFPNFNVSAISSMNDKLESGLFTGRPFGGVAIMWKKSLSVRTEKIECDDGGRYLALLFKCDPTPCVIHCVYFPCFSTNIDYAVVISNLISKIELNLSNYSNAFHVIGGDYNFECRPRVKGYELFKCTLDKFNIFNCDNLITNNLSHTYNHEGLGHRSWIDHFFMSDNLKNCVSEVQIIDSGVNCSDNIPIGCSIKLDNHSSHKDVHSNINKKCVKDRWD